MAEYNRGIDVAISADKAFAFVSDVQNLPRFVPTTRSAEVEGSHVHVEGVANGQEYQDDGQLYVDPERRVMRWGSGASAYRGELLVSDSGDDQAHVEVKLHFRDGSDHVPRADQIEQSLGESLERLRSELTR